MDETINLQNRIADAPFGKRKIKPRVCIAGNKPHVQMFLSETLEEQGFIPHACATLDEMDTSLRCEFPDLVVTSFATDGQKVRDFLHLLAARAYAGKVLLIGPPSAPAVQASQELGVKLALGMLPVLPTPFGDRDLQARVAPLVPDQSPPPPPVDVAEALGAGWLELWYQPKVDTRSLALRGAEALIRMRHPSWGIVPPAYFIPDEDDPHFRALSRFVIRQVFEDWRYLVAKSGRIPMSINLPLAFFKEPDAFGDLRRFPDHPAFDGLTVEIESQEVVQNLPLATETAGQLRFENIGFSIDSVGAEWPSLVALSDFPFAEIKLDRGFVDGSSSTRLKRSVCRQIVDLAESYGAKTVAEGVESRDDFLAMHDLGVDFIQGFLFGKPMPTRKFVRKSRAHPIFALHE